MKERIKKIFNTKNSTNTVGSVDASVAQLISKEGYSSVNDTADHDVFIAGYPKSGNTWVQNLVSGLLLDSTSEFITPRLVNELVPDVQAKKYYKRFFDTMVFKTHELPKKQFKKVIHLVRDGRDALVSYYKMGVNKSADYPYTLEDMIIEGKGLNPSKWHVHTAQWLDNPFDAEIITVRYEDLLTNGLLELKKVCEFLGIVRSDEQITRVLENNTISALRNKVEKHGIDNDHTWTNKPISAFFRKGVIGDYKNEMSEELIKAFNEESSKELKHFNYSWVVIR